MIPLYKVTKSYLRHHHEKYGSHWIREQALSPNPQLKKYYFMIFHYNMPHSSAQEAFHTDEHKLSLKKAIDFMDDLEKDSIPFFYIRREYRRLGNKVFDYKKLKEKYPDIEFAVAYSEDRDEVCEEFNGHK